MVTPDKQTIHNETKNTYHKTMTHEFPQSLQAKQTSQRIG